MQWLGDGDNGVVLHAVEELDLRVFLSNGTYGYIEKNVTFDGLRMRLRVFLSRAPSRKAKKWGISTVYPLYGDGVVKLLPDGSVVDMPWQETSKNSGEGLA